MLLADAPKLLSPFEADAEAAKAGTSGIRYCDVCLTAGHSKQMSLQVYEVQLLRWPANRRRSEGQTLWDM